MTTDDNADATKPSAITAAMTTQESNNKCHGGKLSFSWNQIVYS